MLAVVLLLLTLGSLLNTSVSGFTEQLPVYQEELQQRLAGAQQRLSGYGLVLPQEVLIDGLDPGVVMEMVRRTLSGFGGIVSNVFLVVMTLLFILLEASSPYRRGLRYWISLSGRLVFGDSLGRSASSSRSTMRDFCGTLSCIVVHYPVSVTTGVPASG